MIAWRQAPLVLACFAMVKLSSAAPPNCATCHPSQSRTFPGNAMSHALLTASESEVLRTNPLLTANKPPYSYRIERKGTQSLYTVSDGKQSLTIPLQWAFGIDRGGQTYVFEKDGTAYESRVSYYRELNGLDWTIGGATAAPENLMDAAGRTIAPDEEVRCFSCHATHAATAGKMTFDALAPGVQCARCHEGAEEHRNSFSKPGAKPVALKRLSAFTTEETSNFCGQCHRTWEQIATNGPMSINNVRFQPYRLTKSKCYDTEDKRISCVACHDPHKPLDQVTVNYDSKCRACHTPANGAAKLCKTGTKNCVSCHMPKVELPESHKLFTDHMIRIVRAGEAYPE